MKKVIGIIGIIIIFIIIGFGIRFRFFSSKHDNISNNISTNLVWRYGWNMSKDSLVFCYSYNNVSIYKNVNEKSCIGDVDIDSVRYYYYKDSLEYIMIYYGQTSANRFDSIFYVITSNINRGGTPYTSLKYILSTPSYNLHLSKKDSINFVSATYYYEKWKSMEKRIYDYLVYRYGIPNKPEGHWDSSGIILWMDCEKSKIQYKNFGVETAQIRNWQTIMYKEDSIQSAKHLELVRIEKKRIDDSVRMVLQNNYNKCPI